MNFSYSSASATDTLAQNEGATLVIFIDTKNQIKGIDPSSNSTLKVQIDSVLENGFLKKTKHSVFTAIASGTSAQEETTKKPNSLLLVRCAEEIDAESFRAMLSAVSARIINNTQSRVHILLSDLEVSDMSSKDCVQYWVSKSLQAAYRFDELKLKKKPALALEEIVFNIDATQDEQQIAQALVNGQAIGLGANFTRTLGNRPGNLCTPTHLAEEALKMAEESSIETTIHEEEAMQELGMGSLLSVTAGSYEPAKLIEMHYMGGDKDASPMVLVGKGVTFDTGGISLKPPGTMDEMKYDMCGAATVFGVMQAVEAMQLPINLIGIVGAVENMPGGYATKPGDVVTSMSGKTIEVLNTDAEGRLVLCDALTFAKKYEPELMIDIATLTGACIVALGSHASGLYSNRDELAEALLEAGQTTGDRAWRMPLWKEYTKQLESPFADLGNIGGPKAGSVTAACFLQEFVGDTAWAHLDIAGTAWISGGKKGATGRPLELLVEFLRGKAG